MYRARARNSARRRLDVSQKGKCICNRTFDVNIGRLALEWKCQFVCDNENNKQKKQNKTKRNDARQ